MKYVERNSAITPSHTFHMPANTITNPAKINQPSLTAWLSAIDSEYMMLVSTPRLSIVDMLSLLLAQLGNWRRSTLRLSPARTAVAIHGNTGRNGADDVTPPRSSPTATERAARAHMATLSRPQTTATRDRPIPLTVSWTLGLRSTKR